MVENPLFVITGKAHGRRVLRLAGAVCMSGMFPVAKDGEKIKRLL
jgi:hypothetical protein